MALQPKASDPSCRNVLHGMLTSQWTISDIEEQEAQYCLDSGEASTLPQVRENLETWLHNNPLTEASTSTSSYCGPV